MNYCLSSGLEVDILTAGLPPSAHTGRRHGVIFSKILDFSAITANELEQTLNRQNGFTECPIFWNIPSCSLASVSLTS